MKRVFQNPGFTLSEVLLAVGLAAIALLALVGQSTMLVASNQKLDDTTIATDVAYSIVEQLASEIQLDPGKRDLAYQKNDANDPYDDGAVTVGNTDYVWVAYLTDVNDANSSFPVGTGTSGANKTKLKKMLVVVNWWEGERQGMGTLELKVTRLIKVGNA